MLTVAAMYVREPQKTERENYRLPFSSLPIPSSRSSALSLSPSLSVHPLTLTLAPLSKQPRSFLSPHVSFSQAALGVGVYRQPPADELINYEYAELDTTYNKQGISKASAGNFADALELFRSVGRSVGGSPLYTSFSPFPLLSHSLPSSLAQTYEKNGTWRHPLAFHL